MEIKRPQRKNNRLQCFSYSNPGYYFLTICARNKEKLFGEIVGGGAFDAPQVRLTETGNIIQKYIISTNRISGVFVDKYVIMPNHLHMIVVVEGKDTNDWPDQNFRANETVPHIIGTLKRFVNREVGESVFQRGYHDHVIRGEIDYQKIWAYIEDNPRRWKDDCFFVE